MQWTDEQYPIIQSKARKISVQAYAGTGKTTTLVGYSEANPGDRICYIAFNKDVVKAAKGRFPRNVTSITSHGLAFRAIGSQYQHKLANNLRLTEISKVLNSRNWELVRDVFDTVNNFLCSPDSDFVIAHFPRFKGQTLNSRQLMHVSAVIDHARRLWGRMCAINDQEVRITHDGYLKLWLLSNPNISRSYTTILLDEAQDTNKLLSQFVHQQYLNGCKVVVVGDKHQQLYRFRGADNALEESWLADAEKHRLTQSWRFGFGVAHVANAILSLKDERIPLQGFGERTQIKRSLPAGLDHRTYLCRTVAGVIEAALSCLPKEGEGGKPVKSAVDEKIYWVGGIDGYKLNDILDLYWFSIKRNDKIKGFQLTKDYPNFMNYREIADATQDNEMVRSLRILDTYKDTLPDKIKALEKCSVGDEMSASVTLSTGHKAKGLEWPAVEIWEDFSFDPFEEREEGEEVDPARRDDELNLYYVVATRAMQYLALCSMMISIMQHAKDLRMGRV